MARRQGPQLQSLMYDKACVADGVMRLEAADTHQGQERDAPATGRIDSCIPRRRHPKIHLATGGVHRLSYRIEPGTLPKKLNAALCPSQNASAVSAG